MVGKKLWKSGLALLIVFSMQADIVVYADDIAENSLVVQKTETTDDLNEINEESQIEENVKTEGDEENIDSNIQPDYGEIGEYAGLKNEEKTEKIKTEWQKIDGNWYYYNEDGSLYSFMGESRKEYLVSAD